MIPSETIMKQTSCNISFYCRESKKRKNGLAPIEVGINIMGDRKYISLPRKLTPSQFEKDMSSKKDNPTKSFCDEVKRHIEDLQTEMMKKGIPFTTDNLVVYLQRGAVDEVITLDYLFAEYISLVKKKLDAGKIEEITYKRYQLSREYFYEANSFKGSENVNTITIEHWMTFTYWMNKRYKDSYTCGFQKKVKSVFKYAFETGKITSFPFVKVSIERGDKDIVALDEFEIERIVKKQFNNDRLSRVKDLFLFQCFTALSWTDMNKIKKGDFKVAENGITYIKDKREKTGKEYTAPVYGIALEIALKYDYELPLDISYDKYNKYIKEVGEICEIDKHFTTQLARRTGATYLLNKTRDIELVASVLGDTEKMVRLHYAKYLDTSVFEGIKKIDKPKDPLEETVRIN